MSTARRKPPQVSDELRAALAGLALQGLLANPDISARLLSNIDPEEGTAIGDFMGACTRIAVGGADLLINELNR